VKPVINMTRTDGRLGLLAIALVLTAFASLAPAAKQGGGEGPQTLLELHEDAIKVVRESARERDPFIRANAIEAMQSLPDQALPLAQLGLEDEHPAVRFTALVTIGKMRLHELGPAAMRLLDDPDASVRAAAMFAGKRCDQDVDISQMAQMLSSPNPSLRSNVVMLLGMLGDPSALPMIESMARVPMPSQRVDELRQTIVRVQVAEAQVLLGDQEAVSPLRAAVFSRYGEVRVLAVTMLGRLRDASMEAALMGMIQRKDQPIELKLAAAEALSHIGGRATIKGILDQSGFVIESSGSDNPVLRSQAAISAGALENARERIYGELLPSDPPHIWRLFENRRYLQALQTLLEDDHPQVRLSAAAAVLRALGDGSHRARTRGPAVGSAG